MDLVDLADKSRTDHFSDYQRTQLNYLLKAEFLQIVGMFIFQIFHL